MSVGGTLNTRKAGLMTSSIFFTLRAGGAATLDMMLGMLLTSSPSPRCWTSTS